MPAAGMTPNQSVATIDRFWPWKVCAFLMGATLISYLDRQSFSVAGPLVREELHFDNERLGVLLAAFYLAYAIMHLFVGWILDRFDIRITYALFVLFWSAAQMSTGLASSFIGLYACRFGLGIFEAAGQTGAARIISRIVPQRDRTLANGIMMSGSSLGAILAPPLMIWLAHTLGWRMGFMILGAVGLAWVAGWLFWLNPPIAQLAGPKTTVAAPADGDRWRVILRDRRFWSCAIGAAFGIPIIHISGAWLPTYFIQTWKLKLDADLATYLVVIYVGADLSLLATGATVSFLSRRGCPPGRAKKYVLVLAGVMMVSIGFIAHAPNVLAAVGLVLALNVGRAAFGVIFLSFNQEIAHGRVATIAGIMGAIGAFSGSLMVYIVGRLTKAAGQFGVPFLIVAVFSLVGTAALLATNWDVPAASSKEPESARGGS